MPTSVENIYVPCGTTDSRDRLGISNWVGNTVLMLKDTRIKGEIEAKVDVKLL